MIDFAHDEGDSDMITSLIQLGYHIDTEDFREYKNQKEKDKHWDDYIVEDKNLRKILMSVPFTLVAASNWNTSKSVSILKKLGIHDLFEIIYGQWIITLSPQHRLSSPY